MATANTPSAPVVILRKKRPASETPAAQSVPLQTPPQPQKSSPVAQGKPEKSQPQAKRVPTKPEAPAPVILTDPVSQHSPPPTPAPSGYNRKQRQSYERRQRLLHSPAFAQISAAMVTRWPARFHVTSDTIRPLAIGLANDLCAQLPDFDPKLVHQTVSQWMADHQVMYWQALMHGGPRYDLDGHPKGAVTPEQQAHAREQRNAWFDRRAEIRKRREESPHVPSTNTDTHQASDV